MAALKKLVLPLIVSAAAYYAVFGGEYFMRSLTSTRDQIEQERSALERLRVDADSLAAWVDSLENDPETLERLARERYGMIRDGEILYRFADAAELEAEGSSDGSSSPDGER